MIIDAFNSLLRASEEIVRVDILERLPSAAGRRSYFSGPQPERPSQPGLPDPHVAVAHRSLDVPPQARPGATLHPLIRPERLSELSVSSRSSLRTS
jgi:hypothetical protein